MFRGLVALLLVGSCAGWLHSHSHKRKLSDHLHETSTTLGHTLAEAVEAKQKLARTDTDLQTRARELQETRSVLSRLQQQLTTCTGDLAGQRHQ